MASLFFRFGSPHNVQEYKVATAYRLALETWANWIEANINPLNQDIYFMSMSPNTSMVSLPTICYISDTYKRQKP